MFMLAIQSEKTLDWLALVRSTYPDRLNEEWDTLAARACDNLNRPN